MTLNKEHLIVISYNYIKWLRFRKKLKQMCYLLFIFKFLYYILTQGKKIKYDIHRQFINKTNTKIIRAYIFFGQSNID
jgi:hypothetical protein